MRGESMTETKLGRAHLIAGGFPPGSAAGHDHDYARLRLLGLLAEHDVAASVANDFADVEKWLPTSRLLVTYVAGPYPDAAQRSEEHTSELQSRQYLVCRLLLEKKKKHYM